MLIPFERGFAVKLQNQTFLVFEQKDFLQLTFAMNMMGQRLGPAEHLHDGIRMIVRCEAVDRQSPTLDALVDEHQLASGIKPVLVPAFLHCQSERFHLPFASG